jgi:hypothetical protein
VFERPEYPVRRFSPADRLLQKVFLGRAIIPGSWKIIPRNFRRHVRANPKFADLTTQSPERSTTLA